MNPWKEKKPLFIRLLKLILATDCNPSYQRSFSMIQLVKGLNRNLTASPPLSSTVRHRPVDSGLPRAAARSCGAIFRCGACAALPAGLCRRAGGKPRRRDDKAPAGRGRAAGGAVRTAAGLVTPPASATCSSTLSKSEDFLFKWSKTKQKPKQPHGFVLPA